MPRSNENVAKRSWRIQPSTMNTALQPTTMAPSTQRTGSRHRVAPRPRCPVRRAAPRRRPRRGRGSRSRLRSCQGRGLRPVSCGAECREGASTLGASMGLFNKILHAGEGRKLKSLESIAPSVSALEPEMEARSDDELRALTGYVPRAARPGRRPRREAASTSTTSSPRRSRPSARPAGARSASATSTSRSWAAPRCTSAGSRR